jgi:hypothetical protein
MDCGEQDPPSEFIERCKEMRDVQFDGWIGHDG